MVRRLVSLLAACGVVLGGLTFGAAPASAIETLTVSPAEFTDATQPLDITINGFPTMTSGRYYVYWLDFTNMTGSNTGTTCPTFALAGGSGNPAPTGSSSPNPILSACSWQTGTTFRFVYEGATGLNATSQVTVTFPGNTFSLPAGGEYGVEFTAGGSQEYALDAVCLGNCPTGYVAPSPTPLVTIRIDANGGTCSTGAVTGFRGSWALAPSADACSRYGYTFAGFNTSADGSGLAIAPGGNLNLTTDNTLYAIYETPRLSGPPTDVVAVAGRNEVTVWWKEPADLGTEPVTNYLVTADPSRRVCITSLADANPLSCTLSLPATNTQYTFTVQALNVAGWSDPSTASNAVSPFNVVLGAATRTQDRFLGVFKAGSTLSVSGRGPGVAPGTVITPQVRIGSGDWVSETRNLPTVAADRSISWSKKLAKSLNGTPVQVRLTLGEVASDPASLRVGSRIGVPGAPRNVKVVTERTGVRLSWDAPNDDGGSPVTSYVARANVNGLNTFCRVVAGNPLTCVVPFNTSRVAAGTTVRFTVTAQSERGEGDPAKVSIRGPLR